MSSDDERHDGGISLKMMFSAGFFGENVDAHSLFLYAGKQAPTTGILTKLSANGMLNVLKLFVLCNRTSFFDYGRSFIIVNPRYQGFIKTSTNHVTTKL